MIYKDSSIPTNFNKIAEISDNYIVFVKESKLQNNINYEAYIQYLTPSFYVIYTDNYKIKMGDYYNYSLNYYNNGVYNYVDNIDVNYSLDTLQINNDIINADNDSRADYINIFIGQVICVICILWVFKQFSRLYFKGGLS